MTYEDTEKLVREKVTGFLGGHPNPTNDEIRGLVEEITDAYLAATPELSPRISVVSCDPEARTVTAEVSGLPEAIIRRMRGEA